MIDVLAMLDGVRETGPGRWIARCPAHPDRSPSLSIRAVDDGRVLIHCFAGCDTESVLAAVGMTFRDLMPERIGTEHSYKPVRQRFDVRAVLECVSHEVMVVCLLAEKMARGEKFISDDGERLILAAQRLNDAITNVPPLKTPPEPRLIRSGKE